MPNKDKTGPEGKGSKTGRQMGNCKDTEPTDERGIRPCGRRCGRVRGFRNRNQ